MRWLTRLITRSRFRCAGVIAILATIGILSHAAEVPGDTVRTVVETWVEFISTDAQPNANVVKLEPYVADGRVVAYIAHLALGGFCIAGADDLLLPVSLYSPQGTYDSANPNYRYVLWEAETQLKFLRSHLAAGDPGLRPYAEALEHRRALWRDLAVRRVPARAVWSDAAPDVLILPLRSRWHQGDPFNRECPIGDSSRRTVVGCVATAMSQIMRYWQHPAQGVGTHSYWWSGDDSCGGDTDGATEFADFHDAYDWASMPDECDPNLGCTAQQGDALSELCHEAGVALDMDYGVCASGASSADVHDALETYFKYDPDAHYSSRDIETMIDELQWMRPLHLRGESDTVGHAWVVQGYDRTYDPPKFLMNMGWGDAPGWYTCDDVPLDLVHGQNHTSMIAPLDVVRFVGGSETGDGSPDSPHQDIEEALQSSPDRATLIFRAGSTNYFSASPLTIDRPCTLKGIGITIRRALSSM